MNAHNPTEGFGTLFSTLVALASPVQDAVTGRTLYATAPKLGRRQEHHGWLQAAIDTFTRWSERAQQRRLLMQLDDHLLRDIGVTRADAQAEWQKPFWRA